MNHSKVGQVTFSLFWAELLLYVHSDSHSTAKEGFPLQGTRMESSEGHLTDSLLPSSSFQKEVRMFLAWYIRNVAEIVSLKIFNFKSDSLNKTNCHFISYFLTLFS